MSNDSYDVVVLGGGILGICTAYWAARAGLSVCVVERHGEAGLETTFANGGQISVSHAEPWANPRAPLKVLRWLLDSQAPLLFRPQIDFKQWRWIASFLRNCTAERAKRNTRDIVLLATRSRELLKQVREDEHIQYQHRTEGIVHFYTDRAEFAAAVPVAELMREYGCDRQVLTPEELLAIEPAFAHAIGAVVGATYTQSDESGNARLFCQQLAERCRSRGVTFKLDSEVVDLSFATKPAATRRTVDGVHVIHAGEHARIGAGNVVVCLGSYSAPFLARYGVRLDIYPAKGYSVSIPIGDRDVAPRKSLTDDERKIVYSNLHTHLRVAGTAELAGYDRRLNVGRCRAILDTVRSTFPRAGNFGAATLWTGLRPATPSNVPYVCKSPLDRLWLNTGHGTLGWTMSVGSGKHLMDRITTQTDEPYLEPAIA
jgi:D-amino-acid dehydrogenase